MKINATYNQLCAYINILESVTDVHPGLRDREPVFKGDIIHITHAASALVDLHNGTGNIALLSTIQEDREEMFESGRHPNHVHNVVV